MGGGHTWPGAFPVPLLGETNNDIDATEEILDFFSRWARP
jgi:poly(3-hydroxybutyrate) depolymerase